MSYFSIAGLQLALPSGNNLATIGAEIEKNKRRFPWLDMVVLSELCSYGADKQYAESFPGQTEAFYCQLAKKLNLWLIPGSHFEIVGEQTFNTASVINNHGEVVTRYRKIYPFYPYESGVSCGDKFVVFDVPQGRIGVAICYDLWFPEVARNLTCMGAEVLIYPTLTGTIDRTVEVAMAQSTAATNQCYVFAINAAASQGHGQSVVVGPDGNIIHLAGSGAETIPIEIDFNQIRRQRERGLHGLGQPLKSFRDNQITFSAYQPGEPTSLDQLGSLVIPDQNKT
ncbi:carbon-nitrogen hydrolase family protein [Neptunicella sp.]|uniref:carbon-nitrogen hydrolase family protein n=1 Tax=Neptunicella sp. TaxID=2125986 RepID=UPI003F68D413